MLLQVQEVHKAPYARGAQGNQSKPVSRAARSRWQVDSAFRVERCVEQHSRQDGKHVAASETAAGMEAFCARLRVFSSGHHLSNVCSRQNLPTNDLQHAGARAVESSAPRFARSQVFDVFQFQVRLIEFEKCTSVETEY